MGSLMISTDDVNAQATIVYKKVDTLALEMDIYFPPGYDTTKTYPAMVFFFGGGWINGDRKQFLHHAEYFSKRGAVCFLPDYRTAEDGATPFESVKDAKSALRYIRSHAKEFSIDPLQIIASGGSAGGHLAAATALIDNYNELADDITVSSKPNALVLYNPVLDNGPGGYGYDRIGEAYKSFSPVHNVKNGAPPTILFLGTRDKLVSVASLQHFQALMETAGSRCELRLYEGERHGFFNYNNRANFEKTVAETDLFLQSLGFLKSDAVTEK